MYSIKIYDANGNLIGELPTANAEQISTYIDKGFVVKDINGNIMTKDMLVSTAGVSDGFIQI